MSFSYSAQGLYMFGQLVRYSSVLFILVLIAMYATMFVGPRTREVLSWVALASAAIAMYCRFTDYL